ncbi:MAG: oligopeptide transporter, OPT family [Lachnospiraceae bacterium]|nr:oligopeptide transporter, OPT family [Lachnospiraceae bacterium]
MKEEFKPYIPADKVTAELTPVSAIIGMLLAVVFGAANAYLGLRVGLTVSASIPAAVISMAVIRIIMRRDSILENNMVQTIGSAGESLAAGAIFTMPALFLWAQEGVISTPSMIMLSALALFGGLLGVFFMVPLRSALIVKEHGTLPYPEGKACAQVLLAAETGGSSAKPVFLGIATGALVKFIVDGLCAVQSVVTVKIESLKTEFSAEVYPALLSVGYICGTKISAYMFAGGVLGWFVLIPMISAFGGEEIVKVYADGGASAIWSGYIKYIGAGTVAAAGLISLIKTLPLIVTTFKASLRSIKDRSAQSNVRTDLDLDMRIVIGGIVVLGLLLWVLPFVPISLPGALIVIIFGFFFCAVSSRMVGLVGSSNNPVSGMTIATILLTTIFLKLTGKVGGPGMQAAIAIGCVISISAAMAGDMSQDLKTGYILGATPRRQQIGEILGAVVSAMAIGGVMVLLQSAYGFGTDKLAAPQATMMKMLIESVMNGNLPWSLIFIGAFIAVVIELMGISALPVAIGLYLPLELSTTVMVGGLIRYFVSRKDKESDDDAGSGVLFCSGLIAGEGIIGILLAFFAITGLSEKIDLSHTVPTGPVPALVLLILISALVCRFSFGKKDEKKS